MSSSAVTSGLLQPPAQQRALLWCVLASIALHALVLLGMSWQTAPVPPAKALLVLTARLAPFAAAPSAPVQPPQIKPTTPASEPISAPRPATTKPVAPSAPATENTVPAEPAKAPQPEAASTAAGTAASSTEPAAPVQARAAPQAPASVPATEAGARFGDEADTRTLEQYRLALIVATRRYKRYPAIALEKGWQGRVEVHMVIGVNGMIASTSIKNGSGHEILDNQALDMLKKGKTTVPIPASLRGREFSIVVPVIFNLDNPNS